MITGHTGISDQRRLSSDPYPGRKNDFTLSGSRKVVDRRGEFMTRKILAILLLCISLLLFLICILLIFNLSKTTSNVAVQHPSSNNQASGGTTARIDSTTLAALLGLGGIAIGSLISGFFTLQQTKKSKIHERDLQKKQHQHEQEMLKMQKELDAMRTIEDQKSQIQYKNAEAARSTMQQAQSIVERVRAYEEALYADPGIASLKILDMPSPLSVTSVYVRLRVHKEARMSFALDSLLQEAETSLDPRVLLQANRIFLENRFKTALDPDDAIRHYKHCVIVGDPGAGKTTLLKYLVLKSISKQLTGLPSLPIHIELNAFVTSKYTNLIDFAAAKWDEKYGFPRSEARTYIIKSLKDGNAILLLDALDETVVGETPERAETSYTNVVKSITHIATRYYHAPIVVTARKAGYQQRATLPGFTELEILDFRPQDIRQFVTNWFASHPDPQKRANAIELNNKLERNPRIQALAANPLLLSLIVIVYEAHLDLPDRRAELYKQCVDTLLTKWDASRNVRRRREFKPEHKLQLLEEVAWHFHNQGQRYFPEKDLSLLIEDFLPAVNLPREQHKEILDEIANENGLLKEQARGWHGFLHLTLQEYFVAQRVSDRNQLGLLLSHWGEPWWEEVILLYAGHTSDAGLMLKMLIGQDNKGIPQKDIFYTNLILAGRCLAARPIIRQTDLREIILNQLLSVLLQTPYSLIRELIAETLAEIGGEEVNRHLIDLLLNKQPHLSIRVSVAVALGKIGDRTISHALLKVLANSQTHPKVREATAYALGELGDHSIIWALLSMITDVNLNESLRICIIKTIGELGAKEAIPCLLQGLSNLTLTIPTRGEIALCLGKFGDRSVVPVLLQLLLDTAGVPDLQCAIIDALGVLGEPSAIAPLFYLLKNSAGKAKLLSHLGRALSQLGDSSVKLSLLQLLQNPKVDTQIRQAAANALGILGDRSTTLQLVPLLSDPQTKLAVGQSIVATLVTLGHDAIAPQLLALASNSHTAVHLRIVIIDALGLMNNRSILPDLTRLLEKEKQMSISSHVANAMAQLGDRKVIPLLLDLLSTATIDPNLQWHIIKTLGQMKERSAAPLLLELRSVVLVLLELLSAPLRDSMLQMTILDVLGQLIDDEEMIQKLLPFLSNPSLADQVHRILWAISRRTGKRILDPIDV
jgi:HEAT repeat protein/uncharacterized membrane protein YciS (DUF1049 family)